MNEFERAELESENDGYKNEYERAYAWARMTTEIKNERKKANELVAQGKTVVLQYSPVYCRITDAILGESVTVISVGDDYESAVGPVLNTLNGDQTDDHYEVLPHVTSAPEEPIVIDDIPF